MSSEPTHPRTDMTLVRISRRSVVSPEKHTGGRKNPEVSVYAAGFNGSFDAIDELVSNFPHAGWTCPDEVVMIISRQQSDRFEILFPRGADR